MPHSLRRWLCVLLVTIQASTASRLGEAAPPARSDEELLDYTEARAARYFWEQRFPGNGFMLDHTGAGASSSIAATGFGLAALVVLAERSGTTPEWTVTRDQARQRAEQILNAAVAIQQQQGRDSRRYGKAGCLYHFVNSVGQRSPDSEVSTVDMALLVAGALTAGQYFGGAVQTQADTLFQGVDWRYFFDRRIGQFHHFWKPECVGDGVRPQDGDGCLSSLHWDRPTDEVLLINLLALASRPDDVEFRKSLYRWPRVTRFYGGQAVVNSYFGSLFTYVFAHVFYDFEMMQQDDPASVDRPGPAVDWFLNSRRAALANRQFAIDYSSTFLSYGPNSWGLSACYRPDGTYFGGNGAEPAETPPLHDGTVPPYGAISTMPLLRTSPTEALRDNLAFQALRYYYDTHFTGLWSTYGPRDSFRTTRVSGRPITFYSPLYVGIDVGPEALMIENYRTRLIQQRFMSHPDVQRAVRLQFPRFGMLLGDFNGDGRVTVEELVRAVNFALGSRAPTPKELFRIDRNGDGRVTVDELVAAVDNALTDGGSSGASAWLTSARQASQLAVSGRVTQRNGITGVGGARVVLMGLGASLDRPRRERLIQTTTWPDGSFTLDGLGRTSLLSSRLQRCLETPASLSACTPVRATLQVFLPGRLTSPPARTVVFNLKALQSVAGQDFRLR